MEQNNDILMSSDSEKPDIVIVDDVPENLHLLTRILKERGYKVRPAINGKYALETIRKKIPALILLDIMMPEIDGYEVCRQLKADKKLQNIPIIFLSALNEVFDKVKAFEVGGVDFISKPFQAEEVLARVNIHLTIRAQQRELAVQNEELIRKNNLIEKQAKELHLLASIDSLTGLSNRRDFIEKVQQEEIRFKRSNKNFSLVILDIDHFKKINDKYGHECGDMVIKEIAQKIKITVREQDIVARWGGEEFVCLLSETEIVGAKNVAEKIRKNIEKMKFEYNKTFFSVTVTLGICMFDGSCSFEECIRRADEALYKGKEQGRNHSIVAD